jgi:hypothetical protein
MRLFKPSMLGKAFFLVFGVAQSLHKKSEQDAPQLANCSKFVQFASALNNVTERKGRHDHSGLCNGCCKG